MKAARDRRIGTGDAHRGRRRNRRDAIHIDVEAGPDVVFHGFAVNQLHCHGLNVAVAADLKADLSAGRNVAEHAAQRFCVVDVLAIDRNNNVVNFEPDLAGGCVVIDKGDDRAVNVFELESLRFIGIDVRNIDAKVAGNAGMSEQRAGVFKEWRELPSLCGCRGGTREQNAGRGCGERGDCKLQMRFTNWPQKVIH